MHSWIQSTLSRDLGRNKASIRYAPQKFIFLFLCRSTSSHAIKKNIYHTFTCIHVPQIIYAKSEGRCESDGIIHIYGGCMTTENTLHCSGKERRSRNASYFSITIRLTSLKVPSYLNTRYMKSRKFELILMQWSTQIHSQDSPPLHILDFWKGITTMKARKALITDGTHIRNNIYIHIILNTSVFQAHLSWSALFNCPCFNHDYPEPEEFIYVQNMPFGCHTTYCLG